MPPHTASLSTCDTSNREDGQENIMSHVGAIKQRTTVMHEQITLHAAGEGTSLPVLYQHMSVDRAARDHPLCSDSDTESSQHADVDSTLDTADKGPQTRAQKAQSHTHLSSEGSGIAHASHGQSSDELRRPELYVAAAATTQYPPGPAASRSRSAGSVALVPRDPAKAIWLGFVRRAYRKFGKDVLSTFDLRWKKRGASVLAAAWRRTEVARKFATANHGSAYCVDATDDVEQDEASPANARVECKPSTSLSPLCVFDASAAAAAAPMLDINAHQEDRASVRRSPPSRIQASANVQLRQALTNMIQVGDGGSRGQNWVLTWPSGMVEFDVDQLVLLRRDAALHRSRNARPKPIVHVAPRQSKSESS